MTLSDLEKRLSAVEAKLERMQHAAPKVDWWNQIAGVFANDRLFDDAMREGRKWRAAQRPKARGKSSQRRGRGKGAK